MLDYFGDAMKDTLNMYASRAVMTESEINNLIKRFLDKGMEFAIIHDVTERTPLMVDTYYSTLGSDTNLIDTLLGNSLNEFGQIISTLDYSNMSFIASKSYNNLFIVSQELLTPKCCI